MTSPPNPKFTHAQNTEVTDEQPANSQPSSTAEWVSLAVAAALLMGVIGSVGYLWASDQQRQPPILAVSRSEVRQSAGQYYVPFEITNAGGETAESVQVIAELQINGITVESGEQIIEFLSSREKVGGAFVFSRDPQLGTLVIRVASYQDP
jgi:uncharacterized protein (TIGR02588 family)